jgi:hypothetical protein
MYEIDNTFTSSVAYPASMTLSEMGIDVSPTFE